jgi:squalene-hopene/tetraprenyl-beta-curcumene cyclase
VPDCDDTPGALLALTNLGEIPDERRQRAEAWVMRLQNRDGGVPTFCRGWGKLPFDRSGTDLTAHTLRALCRPHSDADEKVKRFRSRALAYLQREQRGDGTWLPLWFGNQHAADDTNPVYGTARVLAAYRDLGLASAPSARHAVQFLYSAQNPDGGWGGAQGVPSSVEETALVVDVLFDLVLESRETLDRGILWLVERVEAGAFVEPSPIGFYFAKLWYFEKLYPIIFTVAALGRAWRSQRRASATE